MSQDLSYPVLDSTQIFRMQDDRRKRARGHKCPCCGEKVRYWDETAPYTKADGLKVEAHAFCVGDEGQMEQCTQCFMIKSQCSC